MHIKKINTILISLMLIFTFSISVISTDAVFAYAENTRDTKFEKNEKISKMYSILSRPIKKRGANLPAHGILGEADIDFRNVRVIPF